MSEPAASGSLETSVGPVPLREFVAAVAALPEGERTLALWEDQRRRWQRGERVTVEAYLAALPAPAPPDLVVDLVYGEFVLRQEAGDEPAVQEYLDRFPDRAPAIRRQLGIHEHLSGEEPPSVAVRTTVGAPTSGGRRGAEVPAEIAGYRVVAALQAGGQGAVYRGVHPALGRDVVIKVGHAAVGEAGDALMSEGRILAELDHPGLARVYDLRVHDGRPCLVMEYVRGADLDQQAKRHPYAPAAAAALVARVARALAVAHRRGVVHRDVKPRNVLIDDGGNPRVIDFGLALLADAWRKPEESPGVVSGTVSYMAPEQARGETATVRSDVFGLGGVLYFLLTGQAPYPGGNFYDILMRASQGEWDRAALAGLPVPPRLRAIVERALAPDPAVRFASAEEMALALEAVASPPRTRRWLAAAAVAGVTAALAGVVLWAAWRPASSHSPGVTGGARPVARPFKLSVGVKRVGFPGFGDLESRAPVEDGDFVRVEWVAPAGMHAALFAYGGGKVEPLGEAEPADGDRTLFFPAPDRGQSVAGAPGTELILMAARQSGPVKEHDLGELLKGEWPAIPPYAVLQLSPGEAKSLFIRPRDENDALAKLTGKSRFGSARSGPEPESEALHRLDELRRELVKHFDYFEGVTYSHQPAQSR